MCSHPAPFPVSNCKINSTKDALKEIPPIPLLRVDAENSETSTAVILTWEIPEYDALLHEKIKSYELYGYREKDVEVVSSDAWKLVNIFLQNI
jgi:hypothetical protein